MTRPRRSKAGAIKPDIGKLPKAAYISQWGSTICPYCQNTLFEVTAIAGGPVVDNAVRDWYNQCTNCKQWSLYLDYDENVGRANQVVIENPDKEPSPWQPS